MIYTIIFLLLAAPSAWYWRTKYVPSQVARGAADFKRNGAADDLQKGYHGREFWRRVWPGLACCVVPIAPLLWGREWGAAALGFGAMAALLLAIFIHDFSPLLNLARAANGDTWVTEWTASGASKSWPDSASWVQVRRNHYATTAEQQAAANTKMQSIIERTTYLCLLASLLLAAGAVVVAQNR